MFLKNIKVENQILKATTYLIAFLCVFLSLDEFFFWDTIQLASQHATYFFNSNFSGILLPDEIDSGHIPSFGFYLALVWKIFDRNLLFSHLAMLPFCFGIVFQLNQLSKQIFHIKYAGLASLLILLDPTLISQMTLISPDVALAFFMLMAINSILKNKSSLLTLAIILLFLISMRGMMVAFALLLFDIYINYIDKKQLSLKNLLKRSLVYLPALFIFLGYNGYHYMEKSWIGFHSDSPWAVSFESVGLYGIIYNIAMIGHRLLDFGRVGIWLVLFILFVKNKKLFIDKYSRHYLILFVLIFLVIFFNIVWAKYLTGHRYLLPAYLTFSIFTAYYVFNSGLTERVKKWLSIFWLVSVITGHLWVYPDKFSQGWDSSLAHKPYFELREQAFEYLESNKIDLDDVSTFFPNRMAQDVLKLNNDMRKFQDYDGSSEYIIYSNIYNVLDHLQDSITLNYQEQVTFHKNRIFVSVLKRK